MAATTKDTLIGQVFGRLTVVSSAGSNPRGNRMWRCRCSCGGETVTITNLLRSGHTQSCGCLQRERTSAAAKISSRIHGRSLSPEWRCWQAMLARCRYPTTAGYDRYGGRGITVCARWAEFEVFLADVGPRPSLEHSLDRIDPDGNYEPSNVRWASKLEQANNRRDNVMVVIGGNRMTLRNALRKHGSLVRPSSAIRRIKRGWDHLAAVSTPATR